ncbi:MAG: DUF222 domain-containing protein [Gordonia sp. (in: high G+C Gram-positive bacteria)]
MGSSETLSTAARLLCDVASDDEGVADWGVAKKQSRKTRELLIVMGVAPAVAQRFMRIADVVSEIPRVAKHAAEGDISGEHVDAIVKGVRHIEQRASGSVDAADREKYVTDLLAQRASGATPAEIADRAQAIGNQVAAESGVLPAAEDRALNRLSLSPGCSGGPTGEIPRWPTVCCCARPATVDRRRRLIPSYYRRHTRLDDTLVVPPHISVHPRLMGAHTIIDNSTE